MNVEITSFNNTFIEYLCSFIWFNQDRLMSMMERYSIGATEKGEPVFWHINVAHKITNGHIITMDSETGKVYDDSWYYQVGKPMCLFGEHLLKDFPCKAVALVKDEMTAAIMSCFSTPYLWLGTGNDVTTFDLAPLEGRPVIAFPDKGEYDKWKEVLSCVPNIQFHVSDVMEKSTGDFQNVAQVILSQQPLRPTEAEAALMRMEEANPNITLLVKAFGLEVVSVSSPDDDKNKETCSTDKSASQQKAEDSLEKIKLAQEKQWNGRNPECHQCRLSHEGINGTFCDKLNQYVEYGKGDCGR